MMAQSDIRRRNLMYLCGPLATGKLTSVTSSSAAKGVVNRPWKKSRAGIERLLVAMVASSIRAIVQKSPAGSACARTPPSVPMLRTCMSPTSAATSASSGSER